MGPRRLFKQLMRKPILLIKPSLVRLNNFDRYKIKNDRIILVGLTLFCCLFLIFWTLHVYKMQQLTSMQKYSRVIKKEIKLTLGKLVHYIEDTQQIYSLTGLSALNSQSGLANLKIHHPSLQGLFYLKTASSLNSKSEIDWTDDSIVVNSNNLYPIFIHTQTKSIPMNITKLLQVVAESGTPKITSLNLNEIGSTSSLSEPNKIANKNILLLIVPNFLDQRIAFRLQYFRPIESVNFFPGNTQSFSLFGKRTLQGFTLAIVSPAILFKNILSRLLLPKDMQVEIFNSSDQIKDVPLFIRPLRTQPLRHQVYRSFISMPWANWSLAISSNNSNQGPFTFSIWIIFAGGMLMSFAIYRITYRANLYQKNLELSEAKLREATKKLESENVAKDEFLANLSHELRTPLNLIQGHLDLLQMVNHDRSVLDSLATIKRNADSLSYLIKDLLDVSAIVTGKIIVDRVQTDLQPILHCAVNCGQLLALKKKITIDASLPSEAILISADPTRIQQVFWNLISNAIKFTPEGGKISITVHRMSKAVRIETADTGKGISQDFLPHIFEKFRQQDKSTTRAFGGLGLGLSIVHQLVELHNGKITAHSDGQGMGSRFVVTLPLIDNEMKTIEPTSFDIHQTHDILQVDDFDLYGEKILLVDDEPDSLKLLERYLGHSGAEVYLANDVDTAFQIFKDKRPSLVITDICMPLEDGFSLLSKIKKTQIFKLDQPPIIALTAHAREVDAIRIREAGFTEHLTKPINRCMFFKSVKSVTTCRKVMYKWTNA